MLSSLGLPATHPFTYRTAAHEAGLDSHDLTSLVSRGVLRRPVKGVYVAADVPDSIELRCACLRLVVPPDAVICDRHAGWLHGAQMVLAPNEDIDLEPIRVFLPAGRGRLRNELADSGERTFARDDVVEVNGVRVTTPLRTALDLGCNRYPERALAAVDQMLRLGVFTKEELLAGTQRFRGMRWVTILRPVAAYADGRAESPPESVLRLRWIEAHLPRPDPQHEVWVDGEFLARLDLAAPELRFAAEYDGVEWHSSFEQVEHDRLRRTAVEDAGWIVQAFRKENVFGQHANAETLLREGAQKARERLRR